MTPPVFRAVALPSTVLIVDGETCGRSIVVRLPTRREIAEIEAAAVADDIATVLARSYELAGLDPGAADKLAPGDRAALDDVIVQRLAEARSLHLT
ncbi:MULTISPECIES: hypothetical protein [Hyphomicrobiales]|jgi:hypothetical protein|uniref:hypothetical protein n=1 Tax=Methylobacterium sp. CCH7-A2 TaxID=1768789 RepID=UPI000836FCB3|nr:MULTISPECIES: hypothetical protein [Hyphomicrobiales]